MFRYFTGSFLVTVFGLAAAYLCFLFVLPNTINLNQYKPMVQEIAKEQGNINVDFGNVKIITTPLLGAGIKMDDISVKLPDDSLLFSANSLKRALAISCC